MSETWKQSCMRLQKNKWWLTGANKWGVYDCSSELVEKFLGMNVGHAMFGEPEIVGPTSPVEAEWYSYGDISSRLHHRNWHYSAQKAKKIKKICNILKTESVSPSRVKIAFVFISVKNRADFSQVAIRLDGNKFVDETGRMFLSWEAYLRENRIPESEECNFRMPSSGCENEAIKGREVTEAVDKDDLIRLGLDLVADCSSAWMQSSFGRQGQKEGRRDATEWLQNATAAVKAGATRVNTMTSSAASEGRLLSNGECILVDAFNITEIGLDSANIAQQLYTSFTKNTEVSDFEVYLPLFKFVDDLVSSTTNFKTARKIYSESQSKYMERKKLTQEQREYLNKLKVDSTEDEKYMMGRANIIRQINNGSEGQSKNATGAAKRNGPGWEDVVSGPIEFKPPVFINHAEGKVSILSSAPWVVNAFSPLTGDKTWLEIKDILQSKMKLVRACERETEKYMEERESIWNLMLLMRVTRIRDNSRSREVGCYRNFKAHEVDYISTNVFRVLDQGMALLGLGNEERFRLMDVFGSLVSPYLERCERDKFTSIRWLASSARAVSNAFSRYNPSNPAEMLIEKWKEIQRDADNLAPERLEKRPVYHRMMPRGLTEDPVAYLMTVLDLIDEPPKIAWTTFKNKNGTGHIRFEMAGTVGAIDFNVIHSSEAATIFRARFDYDVSA